MVKSTQCALHRKQNMFHFSLREGVIALSIVSCFHFVCRFSGSQVCSRAIYATNKPSKSIVGNVFLLAMLSRILGTEKYYEWIGCIQLNSDLGNTCINLSDKYEVRVELIIYKIDLQKS